MAQVQVGEHEAAQYLPTFSKMTSGSLGCQIAVKCPLIFFLNVLLVTGLSHVHKGLGANEASDILWKKNNSWCWSMSLSVFLLRGTLKYPIYLKDEALFPSL